MMLMKNMADSVEDSLIRSLMIKKVPSSGQIYLLPDVTCWKLETILQEPANCHLYEKCGFVRVGEEKPVNDKMTLIDYELNLV